MSLATCVQERPSLFYWWTRSLPPLSFDASKHDKTVMGLGLSPWKSTRFLWEYSDHHRRIVLGKMYVFIIGSLLDLTHKSTNSCLIVPWKVRSGLNPMLDPNQATLTTSHVLKPWSIVFFVLITQHTSVSCIDYSAPESLGKGQTFIHELPPENKASR